MEIKEIRQITGLSQRGFSSYFGIPLGTLRNWEQGIAKPPEYVFNMIFASLRRDKMINVETIKFIRMLDELAELSEAGIKDFSEATEENVHNMVFYDSQSPDEEEHFPVVLDSCLLGDPDCIHHDVVSYYDSDSTEYSVRVTIEEDEDPFIVVKLILSDQEIVVEDGRWYFA